MPIDKLTICLSCRQIFARNITKTLSVSAQNPAETQTKQQVNSKQEINSVRICNTRSVVTNTATCFTNSSTGMYDCTYTSTTAYITECFDAPSEGGGGGGGGTGGFPPPPTQVPCPAGSHPGPPVIRPCIPVNVESVDDRLTINNVPLPPGDGGGQTCSIDPPRLPCPLVTPTHPIFGLNNSNAVIQNANFGAFLAYVKGLGYTVTNTVNSFAYGSDGSQYPGQYTYILDNSGKVVSSYFTPDANSGPFQVGYNYNLGNILNDSGPTIPATNIIFGSPATFGDGTVAYSPPVNGGGGGNGTQPTSPYLFTISDESSETSNLDPDSPIWWNNPNTTYPSQTLPSYSKIYANYPKVTVNGIIQDMTPAQVYNLIGGDVLGLYTSNPVANGNACAARVSRALVYSGISIPNIPNKTFKGADSKYYFVTASALFDWMNKTFGSNNANVKTFTRSQGGINGGNFSSLLAGKKGIYILKPVSRNPITGFGASGHATVFNGSNCMITSEGHPGEYFNARGGVEMIRLWILN